MRLLLVMLLVSGLLIGESQAQRPFVRFFNNLYANLRNRIGLGGQSGISTTSQQPTVTVTATVTTTVTDSSTSVPDDYVGFAPLNSIVPEISTEAASTDSGMSTTAMEESITEGASTDSPLILQNDPVESTTLTAEDNQVELEIVTEGPELDHSDASVIEAMAQILLEIPTTTPESPTTPNVEFETEAIVVVKDVPPVAAAVVMTSSSTTSYPRDSTTFATLAPKRTIHFSRPSWTPTFLKLANRGSTSRYFFPASFRRPKGNDDDSGFFEMETISLSPSRPLSVENSVPPRIPYVVKRQVEIESSMTVLNQQQSSVLIARAATD